MAAGGHVVDLASGASVGRSGSRSAGGTAQGRRGDLLDREDGALVARRIPEDRRSRLTTGAFGVHC